MKCYCPKCGRENEVSVADLRRQKGTVVCPKCLTTFQMPYTKGDDDGADDTPPPIPKRRAKASTPKPATRRTTAVPRKASTASTPPSVPARTSRTPAKPRSVAKRKPNQPTPHKHLSKAGCVVITICITAGFFLLYTLVGLIFDKL